MQGNLTAELKSHNPEAPVFVGPMYVSVYEMVLGSKLVFVPSYLHSCPIAKYIIYTGELARKRASR